MKKRISLHFFISLLILYILAVSLYSSVDKKTFKQVYKEGKEVFYRFLAERSRNAPLNEDDMDLLTHAEKKIPGLYEHLMNFYYWLNEWGMEDEDRFSSIFKGVAGRMAVELIQSISIKSSVPDLSSLQLVLYSTGYYSRKIIPQFRRFLRPMGSIFKQQWAIKTLEINKIHRISRGKGVRLAIIDTGIDPSIKETRARIKQYKNFLNGAMPVWNKDRFSIDWEGHGTAVATMIYQIAPDAELMIIKFYEGDSMKNVPTSRWTGYLMAAGIRWAVDNGADIINISSVYPNDLKNIRDAVEYCWSKNVVLVAAAGNATQEIYKESSCFPASYNLTIAVGGVGKYKDSIKIWEKSAWGDYIDVVAPAEEMWVQVPQYRGGRKLSNIADGNSLSASIVSGAAALILAAMGKQVRLELKKRPGRLNEALRKILRQTASNEKLGFQTPNPISGYGLIDIRRAVECALLLSF